MVADTPHPGTNAIFVYFLLHDYNLKNVQSWNFLLSDRLKVGLMKKQSLRSRKEVTIIINGEKKTN